MRSNPDTQLLALIRAIAVKDKAAAFRLLADTAELAKASFHGGATRQAPKPYYAGDTALHLAASAYQLDVVRRLVELGADVRAKNRRGSEPLHAAAMGQPGATGWNPRAQAATIALLIEAGANPDAVDKNGATPLHRAVRTRCAAAVRALLDRGADPSVRKGSGTTPLQLASLTTGRGGSGSAAAKVEQAEILRLLRERGAS